MNTDERNVLPFTILEMENVYIAFTQLAFFLTDMPFIITSLSYSFRCYSHCKIYCIFCDYFRDFYFLFLRHGAVYVDL